MKRAWASFRTFTNEFSPQVLAVGYAVKKGKNGQVMSPKPHLIGAAVALENIERKQEQAKNVKMFELVEKMLTPDVPKDEYDGAAGEVSTSCRPSLIGPPC